MFTVIEEDRNLADILVGGRQEGKSVKGNGGFGQSVCAREDNQSRGLF